jgi:hypothetical protein
MRRSLAIGTAILTCLTTSAPSAGQSPSPPPSGYAWVNGTVECSSWTAGQYERTNGVYTMRDTVAHCTVTADDPRVNGPLTSSLNMDCVADGAACASWETGEISGPEGSWHGSSTGIVDLEQQTDTVTVFEGSGAYEGWTFVMRTAGSVDSATAAMEGLLYLPPG